jgi:hypothetical protein
MTIAEAMVLLFPFKKISEAKESEVFPLFWLGFEEEEQSWFILIYL